MPKNGERGICSICLDDIDYFYALDFDDNGNVVYLLDPSWTHRVKQKNRHLPKPLSIKDDNG